MAPIEEKEHFAEDLKKRISTPENLQPNERQSLQNQLNDVEDDLKKSADDARALRTNIDIQQGRIKNLNEKEIPDLEQSQKNLDDLKAQQEPKKPEAKKPK